MIRKQVVLAAEKMFDRFATIQTAKQAPFDMLRPDDATSVQHVLYMLERLKTSAETRDFDTPKANRWLGFIQGVLWMKGVFHINEMGTINGEAMQEVMLEHGWLEPSGLDAVETLCDMLNVRVQPAPADELTPPGFIPFAFGLPFEHVTKHDTARSTEEAFEYTLWRLWSTLTKYMRRNETRQQRIERLAEELTKALAE